MKKIGLVGGTGPESTRMYYRELNTRIDNLTNGKEMPDIAIESVNFHRAWEYVVTAATMHLVFEGLTKKVQIPLVSIPKAVSEEAALSGIRKVGLLGTIFTMEQDFMKKDLCDAGIQVYIPEKEERELRQ